MSLGGSREGGDFPGGHVQRLGERSDGDKAGSLVVPIFGTLSRIRDICIICPESVPILSFLSIY